MSALYMLLFFRFLKVIDHFIFEPFFYLNVPPTIILESNAKVFQKGEVVLYTYKTEAFAFLLICLMFTQIHIFADIDNFFLQKSLEYPCEGFNQFWW